MRGQSVVTHYELDGVKCTILINHPAARLPWGSIREKSGERYIGVKKIVASSTYSGENISYIQLINGDIVHFNQIQNSWCREMAMFLLGYARGSAVERQLEMEMRRMNHEEDV